MEPQIRFCQSADGTRIAYVVLGQGPRIPIISVNSWVYTIDAIMAENSLRNHHERLAQLRRVVTFDRRGTGASQREVGDVSLESSVADLAAVAEQLETARCHLLGYGDGAVIAAVYAARHPERVARLVLFWPFATGGGSDAELAGLVRQNWSQARRLAASYAYPEGPAELQRQMSSALRQGMTPDVAVQVLEMLGAIDIVDVLPALRAQTLVVDFRGAASHSWGREVAALIPNARLLLLPGGLAALQQGEEWAQTITGFVDEEDPTGAAPEGPV
jgi:pimeloyl-ACP methyl ester carboxylesterase